VAGIKPPLPVIREVVPIEEAVPIPIEAPPATLTAEDQTTEEPPESNPDISDAPAVVAVTLDSPAINFSVPTVGNLLVAAAAAQPPPPRPMQLAKSEDLKVMRIGWGKGSFWNTPKPAVLPKELLKEAGSHSLKLVIYVDAAGKMTDIQAQDVKGDPRFVDFFIAHARKYFWFSPPETNRVYELSAEFSIQ
jgi:hypothetical protein